MLAAGCEAFLLFSVFVVGAESLRVGAGSRLAKPSRATPGGRPWRGGRELDNRPARKTAPCSTGAVAG